METSFGQWIGRTVTVIYGGQQSTCVLRELCVAGAVYEDREGRLFIPWAAVTSVRLVPGNPDDAPSM